ncbi:hypothetical protein N9L90_01175 [Planctomycetota bacterium]|nr:hypothetical protein [Planctomycetota bacterium]
MIFEFIDGMSPSHWATLGVALIAADLFLLSSFYVAFFGLMAFGVAFIDVLGAPPQVQAWSLVLGTPVVVGVGAALINRRVDPASNEPSQELVGRTCRVTAISPDDPRKGIGHVAHHGEWPIESQAHDLELQSTLTVTATRGNSLLVAMARAV